MAEVTPELLRRVPLFSGCDEGELAAIAPEIERRQPEAGEVLITQGTAAAHLVVVLSGEARVVRDGVEVNRIRPGEFTGEMAALEGRTYTASVIADGPMDVLIVPAATAKQILEHRGVASRLMSRVVSWLHLPAPAPRPVADDPRAAGWASITAAEQRVIDLVAAGRSNPQVAAELFISRYTVESHLKSVYAKLGVSSRTELAVEAQRRRPAGT